VENCREAHEADRKCVLPRFRIKSRGKRERSRHLACLASLPLIVLLLVGCKTVKDAPPNGADLSASIKGGAADLGSAATVIRSADRGILSTTKSILSKAPTLLPEATDIQANVQTIEGQVDVIDQVSAGLDTARGDIDVLRSALVQKDKKIADLQGSLKASIQRTMMYLLLAGFAMVAVCALMIYSGKPNGLMWGAAGVVVIVLSLTISFYAAKLALVGGLALLVVLAVVAYKIYESAQERQARQEVVKTVEHLKRHVPTEQSDGEFGGEVDDGIVGTLQSPATKAIIAADRAALGLKRATT